MTKTKPMLPVKSLDGYYLLEGEACYILLDEKLSEAIVVKEGNRTSRSALVQQLSNGYEFYFPKSLRCFPTRRVFVTKVGAIKYLTNKYNEEISSAEDSIEQSKREIERSKQDIIEYKKKLRNL